jgi:hypothetical protein
MVDRLRFCALLTAVWVMVALVSPAAVGATHRGEGVLDEVALQMSYQQPTVAGAHAHLIARAIVDDGSPVIGVEVEFLREVDFLGTRAISMGRATTDAQGTARATIDTFEPTILVRVRFMGNEEYLPAEVTSEIHQPVGAPIGPATGDGGGNEPSLAIVATIMPPLLAVIALAIWLLLLGLTAATVLGIRRNRSALVASRKGRNTG